MNRKYLSSVVLTLSALQEVAVAQTAPTTTTLELTIDQSVSGATGLSYNVATFQSQGPLNLLFDA
jgi:hypothetical protein